jgi:hypothetical protein
VAENKSDIGPAAIKPEENERSSGKTEIVEIKSITAALETEPFGDAARKK